MVAMTESQQGIWLSEKIANDATMYCVSERVRIMGELDLEKFIQAAEAALHSSTSLRLRIAESDGESRVSYDGRTPCVEIIDLRGKQNPREAALSWEAQAGRTPWSPTTGAVTHAAILKVSDEEHWWFLRIHHLAIDGFGFYLLNRTIAKAYQRNGESVDLSDSTLQFSAPESPQIIESKKNFWANNAPTQPIQPLATGNSIAPRRVRFQVPGLSAFPDIVIAVGAMALLVGSVSRKSEAVIGLHSMNRKASAERKEISSRQNLLPLRIRFNPDNSISEFLTHVQEIVSESLRFQDYRHESIRKDRALGISQPLVDATLNLIPFASTLKFGDAQGHPEPVWTGPVEGLHLDIRSASGDDKVRYTMNCPADSLSDSTLQGYSEAFRNLLTGLNSPSNSSASSLRDLRIADKDVELPVLRPRFAREVTDSEDLAGERISVEEILADFLNEHTHQPRLVAPDASLSAAEVRAKVIALANLLLERGIVENDIVGIDVRRSQWSILAPVAVLISGAAFVPFDESWPSTRRQQVIQDCQPALLIDDALVAQLITGNRSAGEAADSLLPVSSNPESLAYILYTSGTTGKRKGVMVPRRALENYLNIQKHVYLPTAHQACGNTDELEVIYTYPMDFDGAMSPLMQFVMGNHLHLVPLEIARHPAKCIEYLSNEDIEVMSTSPALLEELLYAGLAPGNPDGPTPKLKYLTVGGERCHDNLWNSLHEASQFGVISVNAYGPTENTVDSTAAWIDLHSSQTIGFPLPGQSHLVQDPFGRNCPVGVAGELVVSGRSLSLGYFQNAAATESAFYEGTYRTGDLVRVEADLSLTFLSRLDDQLSINGIRVEPAEIETAVLGQKGVDQAFATLVETPSGNRLCCYVVGDVDYDLRAALRSELPSSSIPSHVIAVESFPLTERGKIDKSQLPAPQVFEASNTIEFEPGSVAAAVSEVFSEALGQKSSINPDVSLFDVGADSLTAMRIIGLLAKRGYEADLATVFAHPTINALAAQLHEAQDATDLFEYIDSNALTSAQKRIWFLDTMSGRSSAYAMPVKIGFTTAINTTALNNAFQDVCRRYPTLRNIISVGADGNPQVQSHSGALPSIQIVSGSDELLDYSFSLSEDLPIRAYLTQTPIGGTLTVVFNHVALDGWALQTVIAEFGKYYQQRCNGEFVEVLPDITPAAVRRHSDSDLDWWKSHLSGAPQEMTLPLDRPRVSERSDEAGELTYSFTTEQSATFNHLCQNNRITPFVVAQGILAATLYKVGAGTDIVFGTVNAGREHPDSQSYVGYLANTIPVRLDVESNPTAQDFLSYIQKQSHELLEHAHVPFEEIVRGLNPERTPGLHPIFQVMMVMQESDKLAFGTGTEMSLSGSGSAKFDLTVEIIRDTSSGEIDIRWEYAKDILDSATVDKLNGWFLRTLEQFIAQPESHLADFIVEQELWSDMVGNAQTMLENVRADTQTLHARMEDSLQCHSERTAVVFGEQRLSYANLDDRSAHIRDLVGSYAHAGDRVVLMFPRGVEQVAAVVGTVRSGAAYVPVDPENPTSRIKLIIEDSHPKVIVTDESCLDMAKDLAGDIPVITSSTTVASAPEISAPQADDPAYLIFTSGSTGKPKGVIVPQTNPVRLLDATQHWFDFSHQDVWMLFHSYAFDFAVWEMFGAFLHGGSLVLLDNETSRSPQETLELIQREGVTVLNQTPSAFSQLVPVVPAQCPLNLRYIILGGEAVQPESVRMWLNTQTSGTVINMYGITETTVHVTYQPLSVDNADAPPVGVPIPDLAVYLLDKDGNPVPDNVVGEMHVSGAGVSQGYIGREELTAERFIPDPFAAQALGLELVDPNVPKMYVSGDLAYRRDGIMYFTGRADRQVQLRGFRIELEEIESAANDLDEVSWAHCRVVDGGPLGQRLVLYVAVADLATADPTWLRARTAERLPKHMVPSLVIPVDHIPLTVNGKLDTDKLPAPVAQLSQGRKPETELESAICHHFASILGVEEVSAEDSFFDLGGHSMLAVVLSAQLRDSLGVEVRVGTIMTSPTPALLANAIENSQHSLTDLEVLLPLRDRGESAGATLFCIHPAGGMSWCYSGLPPHLPADISVYGLQARGILAPDQQPASLAAMADDYISEMKKLVPEGPFHILGWSLGGMVAQVVAEKLSDAGEEVGLVALLDAYPSEAAESVDERSLEEALSALLAMAGLEDDALGASPTLDDLDEILHDFNSPMAGLQRGHLENIVTTYRNTSRILREHQHQQHHGDMVLFRAQRGGIGPVHDPHEWDIYATGDVDIVDVDCTHREMTQPMPIKVIGQYITENWAKFAR